MAKRKKSFGIMLRNSECEVITFDPVERPDIIKELSQTKYNHSNYDGIEKCPWFDFDCVTILKANNEIVGFSSIWHRPEYYEKGEVRILNRYWENHELRRPGRELARDHIIKTVQDQLMFAKSLGYTKAFISRERNPKMLREFINNIAIKTNTDWQMYDEKISVCEGPGCLQYKGFTKL